MDFRYARPPPPPPPSSDPHQPPPPRQQPVPPPPGTWYPGQFQYHSPSPPPPHWAPQPQYSDPHIPPPPHLSYASAPPPPPPPYGSNPYSLPPRPHMPPPPPPPPPHHQYPSVNQEWSNTSWGQVWDYSVHNKNEDDWAARAKEWAASKAVPDDHHQQSQLGHTVRPEEINYQDQYSQNPSYSEFQQHSNPPSSYQQYPSSFPPPPPPRTTVNHVQDPSQFNSGYAFSYNARNENSRGDSTASYSHQETSPTSLSVHQQEVPSSYSSVAGKEEGGVMNGHFYQPSHLPYASAPQHQVQPLLPPGERSFSTGQPHYSLSNPSNNPTTDLSNQPLDFGPRFNNDHDPFGHSKYANGSGVQIGAISTATDMPSIHSWSSSAAPGMLYPSMPSVHHTEQQIDSSVTVPTSVSAHSTPLFGRISGVSFQPTMASVSPPFPVGTSNAFLATNAFPGDIYGTPGFPERPKKASVPNWLREEIIKKKAVIGSSGPEVSKQETESNEDEGIERSLGNGDQADGKNMDASRSTEEEDDDEDYVEAARTAAINQEIKRILTEVLLKVTDELFDEIATKVLNEDYVDAEVEHNTVASSEMTAPSTPAISTPKSSTKVLVQAKTKETDSDNVIGKYTSSSPGDLLGLGSYASDDDEDEEVQNSSIPSSKSSKPTVHLADNGSSQVDGGVLSVKNPEEVSDPQGVTPNGATGNHGPLGSELTHNTIGVEPMHSDFHSRYSSNIDNVTEEIRNDDSGDVSKSKESVGDKGVGKIELPIESLTAKNSIPDDAHGRKGKNGADRTQRKVDENIRVHDERHIKRAKKDDQNGSRDKVKERDSGKKVSKADLRDDRKGSERDRRSHAKEEDRKRERAKDERRKPVGDSSKHKRHRSSSPESRGRSSKDNSSVSHARASSDGSSDDSKRKVHSKRRGTSPSDVRSRRQVSRSPPSKRSHRRHSPYSFLETKRERRRSRSRTRKG